MKYIFFNISHALICRGAALLFLMLLSLGSAFAVTICPPSDYSFGTSFLSVYKNITVTYSCNNQNPLYTTKLFVNDQEIGLNTPGGCSSTGTAFLADGSNVRFVGKRDIGGGNFLDGFGNAGNGYYPASWVR